MTSTIAATGHALLSITGLRKSYGANVILDDIDFTVAPGEIVSVVGENGAGKSTFAKVLAGIVSPDAGNMSVLGEAVSFDSPRDALAHQVGFIPQELAFVPTMTVADNVMLGRWPRRGLFTSRAATMRAAATHLVTMQIDVRPQSLMSDLRLAEQQMIEIVKVMARDIRLLILDEPTASLSQAESDRLMAILRTLAASGVGIVLISHRFDEVLSISDRVDVFRNAKRVFSASPEGVTPSILVGHMLGQAEPASAAATPAVVGEVVLALSGWQHAQHPMLHDVSFELHAGEVLCLFGVRGSGVEIVAEALTGRRRSVTGDLALEGLGMPIPDNPRRAIHSGISFLPPDRKRQGLILARQIQENMTYLVPRAVSRGGFVRGRTQRALATEWSSRMRVRSAGVTQPVEDLSGGNQQKVLLASRLITNPRILILEEPTRGVDIGARLQIHQVLRAAAREGAAVLLVTPDVEEAASVSDRILVMRDGRLVGEMTGDRITPSNVLHAAAGEHES